MNKRQLGITLSGLLVAAFLVAVFGLLGLKVVPEYMEYRQIVSTIKKVAAGADPAAGVAKIREAYDRQANMDYISAVAAADLEITKESNVVVISFSYEKRIPLFANISLLLDFQGSSRE